MILTETILRKIERNYNFIYNTEEILPTSWNHIKKQYVAEIIDNKVFFISSRENYSRSRANADLTCSDIEKDTYFVVYDGSHKHMTQTYYYAFSDYQCVKVCEVEDDECYDHPQKEWIDAQLLKLKNTYKLNQKRKAVMSTAKRIFDSIKSEGLKALWSECVKASWKHWYQFSSFFGSWFSYLQWIEDEKKRKEAIEKQQWLEKQAKEEKRRRKAEILTSITGSSEGYWNGKIYSGNRIYVEGVQYNVTDEEVVILKSL